MANRKFGALPMPAGILLMPFEIASMSTVMVTKSIDTVLMPPAIVTMSIDMASMPTAIVTISIAVPAISIGIGLVLILFNPVVICLAS